MKVSDIAPARTKKRAERPDVLPLYHYTACGLENVFLVNVQQVVRRGEPRIVLKSAPTLQRVIVACFANKPAMLRPEETRFIRSVLGYSAKNFAEFLSISPEHLSRIENGHEPVSKYLDKMIRMKIALDLLQHEEIRPFFDIVEIERLVETELPACDGSLALFLEYTGQYVEDHGSPLMYKFEKAA